MGRVQVNVRSSAGIPIPGARVQGIHALFCLGIPAEVVAEATTDSNGTAFLDFGWPCIGVCILVKAYFQDQVAETNPFLLGFDCSGPTQNLTMQTPPVGGGPQFEITSLFVKRVDAQGNQIQNWDMLNQVGSPEPGHTHEWPQIPAWTSEQGPHNFQIEAAAKNLTSQPLTVKFRTMTEGLTSGGHGDIVDSPESVTIPPGETMQLPIWQLRMWSENIHQHNWIVDAQTGQIYNCGVDYYDNNYHYYPDTGYRADDWYIPVNVLGVPQLPSWWWILALAAIPIPVAIAVALRRRRKAK